MKKLIVLAIAAAACLPAVASDFYAGGDISRNKFTEDGVKLNHTAFAVYGGYTLNPTVAFEAGYRSLMSETYKVGANSAELDAYALQLSAVFSLPVADQFSVYGRLGLNNLRATAKASVNGVKNSAKDNETKALFGVGARYALSQQVGLRVEFQKPASNVQVLAAGVDFRF
jgi:OOP family OmpA-OmpF porin